MKKQFLCALLAALFTASVGASSSHTQISPVIQIEPDQALVDEAVKIRLAGLAPKQHVTLKASMTDNRGHLWQSSAEFDADQKGVVDLTRQAPAQGGYTGVDPMGLFWSMKMVSKPQAPGAAAHALLTPVVMKFELESEGKIVATANLTRLFMAPGVRFTDVTDDGLVARLYEPEKGGPHPGLIVLGGSEGGIASAEGQAAILASRGYAALAVAYFGMEGLPKNLVEVPLDYMKKAVDWMGKRNTVARGRLGAIGGSKGGELALLMAARFPELKAVVAYVPSNVVWAGIGGNGSSWSYQGKPLPYAPYGKIAAGQPFTVGRLYVAGLENKEAVAEASIPVERINGPVLLISGKDDQLWPSAVMAEMIMARLKERKHKHKFESLSYEGAGHAIGYRHWPTTHTIGIGSMALGGAPAANAKAQADSWPKVLRFLKVALRT
ncbi:MAG: acyl-CoA thioester hydrolase/BAAT C-terminal domain-containing protein [Blastocatellia bacterium]